MFVKYLLHRWVYHVKHYLRYEKNIRFLVGTKTYNNETTQKYQ